MSHVHWDKTMGWKYWKIYRCRLLLIGIISEYLLCNYKWYHGMHTEIIINNNKINDLSLQALYIYNNLNKLQ